MTNAQKLAAAFDLALDKAVEVYAEKNSVTVEFVKNQVAIGNQALTKHLTVFALGIAAKFANQ